MYRNLSILVLMPLVLIAGPSCSAQKKDGQSVSKNTIAVPNAREVLAHRPHRAGLPGAPDISDSVPSTQAFEKGASKLIVYSDVPGLVPSEFYTIRVRSAATDNQWVDCFALITRNLISSLPPGTEDKGPTRGHYQKHTTDWSHTYGNIEMSPNSPVEVEISRRNGPAIKTATTHPSHKAGKATVTNGKAYFSIDNPSPITIDIDGQMDDQHTGEGYSGPPIHTLSLFAHPIMEKPALGNPGVIVVKPGGKVPAPDTYTTLCFAPGIHDLGRKIKVHPNKSYYIPGDAIVYGTFNNFGLASGHNIRIYGVGTISGDRTMHPLYDDDHLIRQESRENWKSISIKDGINVEVTGVCVANPAEHSINLNADAKRPDRSQKVTFVRWAKVISWRANGDGIGSAHVVEDCFLRCGDDCSYIKGDRRRCVFWKDTNAAVFHMAGIPNDFPIVIEDCDVLYNRSKNRDSNGGGVFVQRTNGPKGQQNVNVLVQDFRVHDLFPTMSTFSLVSKYETGGGRFAGNVGSSCSGITFRNITVAAKSIAGQTDKMVGCAEAPWNGGITFDNVVIAGKKLTRLEDLGHVNEYVTNITFVSGDDTYSLPEAAKAPVSDAGTNRVSQKADSKPMVPSNPGNIKWNVLVLMTDMHNVHYVGCDHQCTENILTPNLDRIGREGMIFRKAYDAYPVCAPTRASLLTGTYPFRHGQFHNSSLLTEAGPQGKTPSLAHLFRDNGYNTAMWGKQHSNLEPLESLPDGTFMGQNIFHGWDFRRWTGGECEGRVNQNRTGDFAPTEAEYNLGLARQKQADDEEQKLSEEYQERYPEKLEATPMPQWEKELTKENAKYTCNGKGVEHAAKTPDGVISFELLDYLDTYSGKRNDAKFGIDRKKPFLMFLSMQKPHYGWTAPLMQDGTEFWYMYSARPEEDSLTYLHNGKPEPRLIPSPIKKELLYEDPSSPYFGTRDPYNPEAERFARAKYSACISWLDHQIGKVLDKLAVLDDPRNPGKKLNETTIVCFTTDHGDMMGEKKRISKMVTYEGSARVPFLIRMPGVIAPGQYSDILFNHVDMFPTLAGLAGLGDKVNSKLDGKDYSKALLANNPKLGPERTFMVSKLRAGDYPGEIMSRTQRYKFTRWSINESRSSNTVPDMLLFDMDKDPSETTNLAYDPAYRDVVIAESRACDEFMASFYPLKPVGLTVAMLEGRKKEGGVQPAAKRTKTKIKGKGKGTGTEGDEE